jgi:hypothetical protein
MSLITIKNILKMKKNILILGIALLLITASGFAQGGTDGTIMWRIENDTLFFSGEGTIYGLDKWYWPPWICEDCFFTVIVIENDITRIGNNAFKSFFLITSVVISNSVRSIGVEAFLGCSSLTSIILPSGVTRIEESAFVACSSLTSVTIPNSITSIENWVFANCENLTLITNFNPVPVVIDSDVFKGVNKSACTLEVPINSVSAYQNAAVWKEFNNIVGIDVDIDELQITNYELRVYPNPSTGACSITIPDEFLYESALTLSVYDTSGKLIQQIVLNNDLEIPQLKLDHKAQGVYVMVLSNGRKEYKGKVVFN